MNPLGKGKQATLDNQLGYEDRADILDMKTKVGQKDSNKHLGQEHKSYRTRITVSSDGHNSLV